MTSVSTSAFYDSAIYNMTQLQSSTQALQTQISTGNKLTNSYDDPLAAAQMRSLQRADALATADSTVSDSAQTNLNLTDNTLSQFSKIVTEVQTLATQAANSTLTDAQRSSVGTQITSYYNQMVSLANTSDANGNALFGGQGTGQAYSVDASGNATYVGGASAATATLGPNMTVTTGVTGPEFMDYTSGGTATNLLSVVKNLGTALTAEGTSTSATSAVAPAWCCRRISCFAARSATTSPPPVRKPAWPRSSPPPASPAPTNSSAICRWATIPRSRKTAPISPVGNASASPSPARCCPTRDC